MRYETYRFFHSFVLSPPPWESAPSSSEGKRPNVLGIILGVVATTLVLIAAGIGLWKWNICSQTGRGEEEDFILMANISNRDLIFKYDILREAISNFKVENKLGDGGFGSVFKVRA